EWDVFISYAWEDKERFVRPLAEYLISIGVNVWYDEMTLIVGDSLSRSIDQGIIHAKYGVVVLSKPFLSKGWTDYELRGLIVKEVEKRDKITNSLFYFHLTLKNLAHVA
ncbi:MAG: toll/interleukin-1 receptor domain-containing protein, partial [Deltaproteobacteria bacterium]|nr:toll/interleukin-1 receptor domain-containing protein [Deltaproteobacteria bacterium]